MGLNSIAIAFGIFGVVFFTGRFLITLLGFRYHAGIGRSVS